MLIKISIVLLLISANSYAAFDFSESAFEAFATPKSDPNGFTQDFFGGFSGRNTSQQPSCQDPFQHHKERHDMLHREALARQYPEHFFFDQREKARFEQPLPTCTELATRTGKGLYEGMKTDQGKKFTKNAIVGSIVTTAAIGVATGSVALGQNYVKNRALSLVNEEYISSEEEIYQQFAQITKDELDELKEYADFQDATFSERITMQRELLERIEQKRTEAINAFREANNNPCTIM